MEDDNAFDGLEMEEYYENGKIEGLKTAYQLEKEVVNILRKIIKWQNMVK